jgi:hypothetical protein
MLEGRWRIDRATGKGGNVGWNLEMLEEMLVGNVVDYVYPPVIVRLIGKLLTF